MAWLNTVLVHIQLESREREIIHAFLSAQCLTSLVMQGLTQITGKEHAKDPGTLQRERNKF